MLVLGLFVLMVEAFFEQIDKRTLAFTAIFGLAAVLAASFFLTPAPADVAATGFWNFYTADPLAIFFKRFALVTTILVLVMMIDYAPIVRQSIHGTTHQSGLGEFFALPIFTCAGLMWMASAIDFVMIFVSLELVTMSFYVLVSFTRRNPATLEAGVKYLILSALSTGFLVYGITWIFGVTGETNLARITAALANPAIETGPALFGMVLVLVALGFKIAAVPFQMWVPDVYQGAPTPVTAFLSVGSKAAGFVVLLRVLQPFFILPQMERLLTVIALLTLIYGNLAALPQSNLKRLLAYSSIAHAGYLLIGVVSSRGRGRLVLSRRLSAHDAAEFRRSHRRRETDRGKHRRLQRPGETLAFSRLRHADRDGLARRRAVHRRISGQVLYLRRRASASSDHARRRGRDYGRLRILLLSESRARDVLGRLRERHRGSVERIVAVDDGCDDRRDHFPRRLSAAGLGCVDSLKR